MKQLNELRNLIWHGDSEQVLGKLPDGSIDLTFTSPPYYNARSYAHYQSYETYLNFLIDIFTQVHRITKEGRFLIVNTSPVIEPRKSRQHASKRYPIPFDLSARLTGIGWEFIDDIVWVKPEPSVKNRNAGFLQHRKPLGYKPNSITEYLMVYRKKTHKLLDWNMRQYDAETVEKSKVFGEYETSNLWAIPPVSNQKHPAIFPSELCRRVIQFYSYVGDLVLDPFAGIGTVGEVCLELERNFLLIERDENYVNYMRQSLRPTLFQSVSFRSGSGD